MKNSLAQKLNKFKTSPLIIGLAIIEVIILICVSTYAWFIFADNNKVYSDVISVEPDSGLEIDFNNANENDYINIWNYLEEFQFEPVTSLDGRNLFIPTTGTFNAYAGDVSPDTPSSPENPGDTQNTYLIYFDTKGTGWRNTPYIECDYAWHEDYNIAMTRLNSTSTIYYYDLAPLINKYNFTLTYMKFTNGKGGNGIANITNMFGTKSDCIYPTLSANYLVKCELDSNGKAIQGEQANHYGLKVLPPVPYSGTVPDIGGGGTGNSGSGEGSGAVADKGSIKFREATVNDMNSKYINIDFTLTNTNPEDMPVYLSSRSFFKLYDPATDKEVNSKAIRMAFYQNDGSSGKITSSILSQEYEGDTPEDPDDPGGGTGGSTYTVYLDPPFEWTDASQIRAYVFGTSGSPFSFPGEVMQYDSSTGYYYYTADRKYNKVIFNYHGDQNQTVNLDVYDQGIYVLDDGRNGTWALDHIQRVGGTKVEDDGTSGSGSGNSGDTGESEGQTTVYFNNTLGWKQPHAYIWQENASGDVELSAWPGKPMTHISGTVYYYTFNSKYDSIIFNDGNNKGGAVKTGDIYPVKDGYIYMIGAPTGDNEFGWTQEDYIGSVEGGTYPVISPGVSTGFQRPYAPVTQIDDNSGTSKVVIPAFASSIDDYNNGSGNPLFTIKAGQTLSLSMIIWLEGTDPDCTEDVYAGKYIDMNLVFATPDSQGEDMYTYQFLDKTKENWIDDVIKTDTGVSFKPVVQLYDAENHKGYLMSVHDDEEGKPTIWQCRAPVDLIKSKHIMFRRVNPMKEDEVWNYWDTDGFGGISEAVKDEIVTFTAFSDGSPTTAKNENGTDYTGAPTKSCGGLWGEHNVEILVVYDGTKNQWIDDTNPVKDGFSGALTIKYTYNDQEVEYKATGSGQSFYYFVIPECIKTGTDISFSRYYNYNTKFGFNSPNNSLVYHRSWDAGKYKGSFYEISETYNGTDYCYWGDDIHYVQVNNYVQKTDSDEFSTKFDSDSSHMQIRYTDSDGDHFYSYLFKNSAMKGSHMLGYASVIPSGSDYVKYRVERCKMNDPSVLYYATDTQTINSTSKSSYYSNTVVDNICLLQHFKYTVYYKKTVSEAVPKLYQFLGTNSSENSTVDMEYDSAKGLYFVDWNISLYDKFEIHETIPNTTTTAYLIPNNNWKADNARFALYLHTGQTWKSATQYGSTGIYRVTGISNNAGTNWVRMNPSTTTNNWDNDWNQTADYTFTKAYPICRVDKGQWGNDGSGATYSIANAFKSDTWGKDSTEATTFNGVQYAFSKVNTDQDNARLNLSQSSVSGVESKESVKSTLYNNAEDLWS